MCFIKYGLELQHLSDEQVTYVTSHLENSDSESDSECFYHLSNLFTHVVVTFVMWTSLSTGVRTI